MLSKQDHSYYIASFKYNSQKENENPRQDS